MSAHASAKERLKYEHEAMALAIAAVKPGQLSRKHSSGEVFQKYFNHEAHLITLRLYETPKDT